jgi:hypothetical protein
MIRAELKCLRNQADKNTLSPPTPSRWGKGGVWEKGGNKDGERDKINR